MKQSDATHGSTYLLLGAVAVATVGGLLFGYDGGAVNGTQSGLKHFFSLDDSSLGFAVGSLVLGCALGALGAGRLADLVGRRSVMLLAAVLFIGGAAVQGLTSGYAVFLAARFISGVSVGSISVMSPAYISEIVPAGSRGRLATMQQIMIIAGATLAFLVNYLVAHGAGGTLGNVAGHYAWQWMYLAQIVPALFFLGALVFIPESPRYLVSRGKADEALAVLKRLVGVHEATRLLRNIQASFVGGSGRAATTGSKNASLFRKPIVWIGIAIAVFQQVSGINVIFYYGETLWRLAGVSESAALQRNIMSGTLSMLACIVTVVLIDKIGRKPLLMLGSIGMAASLAAMSWAFGNGTVSPGGDLGLDQQTGMVALVAANAYVIFFNGTWGPVMWVMLGEMFPNRIRGPALGVCGLAVWVSNYVVIQLFPIMAGTVGLFATYLMFSACALASFVFVRTFVSETSGRELEDMAG